MLVILSTMCETSHLLYHETSIKKLSSRGVTMAIPFRFAFQGGGAKFVTLLAAAKAIYDLEQEDIIQIDHVAGTSAGAIAAGLLASGIDPAIYRNHLRSNGHSYLSKVLKPRNKYHTAFRVFVQGHSLYDHYELRKFIEGILSAGGIDPSITINDTKHNLSIITSDLNARGEKIYCRLKEKSSSQLSAAIANSCSLPIIFKSIRGISENHIVDGGIVNNLPISHISDSFEKSRIVAFSFEKELSSGKNNSLSEYVMSLIDTSINSNIISSMKFLPETNIFKLPNNFSTMSFKEALSSGLDDHFDNVRDKTRASLLSLADQEARLDFKKRNGTKLSRTINEKQSAAEIFNALYREDIEFERLEVCMIMNSLRDKEDPEFRVLDIMHTTYKIPLKNKISGIIPVKVFIASNSGEIDLTASEIEIFDDHGRSINFSVLVGEVRKFSTSYNFPLYIFIKCSDISPDAKYITVRHIDTVENAMPDIFEAKNSKPGKAVSEAIAMICSQPKYNNVEWRVHLPASIMKHVKVSPLNKPDENVHYSGIANGIINEDLQGDQRRPINYRVIQWKSTEPVFEGQAAGFDISLNPF
ncbi:hypothetical protein PYTT13_22510 (plasmid) [Paracoccus yeei]|uniref:PNPLA domain-containing protein n=2 Tax=Paracoccus yeei TaxID=147645 RepID=A0A2D2C7V6_9RHOB|nr:hypothetical protein PYTT13_22510 [Paracoccus yeei]